MNAMAGKFVRTGGASAVAGKPNPAAMAGTAAVGSKSLSKRPSTGLSF
jgi:hypothetical protein